MWAFGNLCLLKRSPEGLLLGSVTRRGGKWRRVLWFTSTSVGKKTQIVHYLMPLQEGGQTQCSHVFYFLFSEGRGVCVTGTGDFYWTKTPEQSSQRWIKQRRKKQPINTNDIGEKETLQSSPTI